MSLKLHRRIERLEQRSCAEWQPKKIISFRVCPYFGNPDLENATYGASLWPKGVMVELVQLDGHPDELAEGELETWLALQRSRFHACHQGGRRGSE